MSNIYIVGIGPGDNNMMTKECHKVLSEVDVIVGYGVYIDLIKEAYKDKEYASTPMKREIERCRLCYEYAASGKNVALICSGDSGVYGMAAPMIELSLEYGDVELVVIPGVTAALSGAAVLGAPINHDFCVISLSDLLTPWEMIEKRIRAAIMGDFAIVIYNPSSKKRHDYLKKAIDIMMDAGADDERACGYVRNIGRDGLYSQVLTLNKLRDTSVDMFTTVFVGSSKSVIIGDKLVTKRGYEI